jgi:hypothetical protein
MVKIQVSFDGGAEWSDLSIRNLVQFTQISKHVDYIEGSRTYDNLRFGARASKHMPYVFEFTDATNVKYKVWMERESDVLNMIIPCGSEILWHGADQQTRTGSDAQTNWAHVCFSYIGSDWVNYAGVRVQFEAYRYRDRTEWCVDTERWKNVLERTKQGLEITGEIIDQAGKVSTMIATGGVVK